MVALDSSLYQKWGRKNTCPLGPIDYGYGNTLRQMTIEEHLADVFVNESGLLNKAMEFVNKYTQEIEAVLESAAVRRLASLWQLGTHSDRHPGHIYPHTRLEHSRIVAAYRIAIGIQVDESFESLITSVVAALLHDIGHSAYSHDADHTLEKLGYDTHEMRGDMIIRSDPEIQKTFNQFGISMPVVLNRIHEKGSTGQLQSLMDTLSYVVLDAAMFGVKLPDDFAWQVISSVVKTIDGCLVLTGCKAIQTLLQFRAQFFNDVYRSSNTRVGHYAIRCLLYYAFAEKVFSAEEVITGTDQLINSKVKELFSAQSRAPQNLQSLYLLTMGHGSELERWNVELTEKSTAEMNGTPFLKVSWWDFSGKTIPVIFEGKKTSLRAKWEFGDVLSKSSFTLVWK